MKVSIFPVLILSLFLFYSYADAADNVSESDLVLEAEGYSIFSPTKLYFEHDDIGNINKKISPAPNEFLFTLTSVLEEPVQYIINFEGDNASYFLVVEPENNSDNDSIAGCLAMNGNKQRTFKKDETCVVRVLFGGDNISEQDITAGEKTASLIVSYVGNKDTILEYKFSGKVIEVADIKYKVIADSESSDSYISYVNLFSDTQIGERSKVPYIWIDSNNIDISEDNSISAKYKLVFEDGFFDSFEISKDETTCELDKNYNLTIPDEPCYLFIYFTPHGTGSVSKKITLMASDIKSGDDSIIMSEILTGVGIDEPLLPQ